MRRTDLVPDILMAGLGATLAVGLALYAPGAVVDAGPSPTSVRLAVRRRGLAAVYWFRLPLAGRRWAGPGHGAVPVHDPPGRDLGDGRELWCLHRWARSIVRRSATTCIAAVSWPRARRSSTPFSVRADPSSARFLAGLLMATGQNLRLINVILVIVTTIACFVASLQVQRQHGPLASTVFLLILSLFYRRFVGTLLTRASRSRPGRARLRPSLERRGPRATVTLPARMPRDRTCLERACRRLLRAAPPRALGSAIFSP